MNERKKEHWYSKMPKFNQFKNRNKLIVLMYLILWGICWTLHPNIYGGFKNWSQTTSFLFLSKWKMKKQFWKMSDWEFLLSRTFIFRSVMLSCFALVQGFFHKLFQNSNLIIQIESLSKFLTKQGSKIWMPISIYYVVANIFQFSWRNIF